MMLNNKKKPEHLLIYTVTVHKSTTHRMVNSETMMPIASAEGIDSDEEIVPQVKIM